MTSKIDLEELHEKFFELKLKDFMNFSERVVVEYNGQQQIVGVTYLSNKVVSRLGTSNIKNLIQSLELKPFEMIVIIDRCARGHA